MPRTQRSTSSALAVKVEGLVDLQAALRSLDAKLPRELRKVNLSVAQNIASMARDRATQAGGVLAKAAPAIRAGAEQRSSFIRLVADEETPFIFGAEFGAGHGIARVGKSRSGTIRTYAGFQQFQPWRGNGSDAGYALYPTIREQSERIVAAYEERIAQLLEQVLPT